VADEAVRAITRGEPCEPRGLGATIGVGERGGDAVGVLGEGAESDAHLGLYAERRDVTLENRFGVVLRDHQDVGVGGLDAADIEADEQVLARENVGGVDLVALGNQVVADAGAVEQLECSCPDGAGPRLGAAHAHLVDQTNRHAVAGQFQRHREADGAGTGNEDSVGHRELSPSGSRGAVAGGVEMCMRSPGNTRGPPRGNPLKLGSQAITTGADVTKPADDQAGRRGPVINISSIHEDQPMPGNTAYCLSKGDADADADRWRRTRSSRKFSASGRARWRRRSTSSPSMISSSLPHSTRPFRSADWRGQRKSRALSSSSPATVPATLPPRRSSPTAA
jgi:hypothetical protein